MKQLNASDFLVFGYFGLVTNQLDGQTVKTRSVHRLLEEKLHGNVSFYDTEKLKKSKVSLSSALLKLAKHKEIIYLPAGNNLKKFFPLLFFLSKLFSFNIHYFVVGGWLPKLLETHPSLKWMLKKISNIFVETTLMQKKLTDELGFDNISIFPNFRFVKYSKFQSDISKNSMFKVVFMSRISRMKGIDFVFKYAKIAPVNTQIDFYGPINKDDKCYFLQNIEDNSNTKYLGILQPEAINGTLAEYDVMVLPTMYFTEGLPGAIVDAYSAGIPVIATKWVHAHEFVLDGETGFSIPFENGFDCFVEKLNSLNENRVLLKNMKNNATVFAKKFNSDYAWSIINEKLVIK